jgi:hypothetical protein
MTEVKQTEDISWRLAHAPLRFPCSYTPFLQNRHRSDASHPPLPFPPTYILLIHQSIALHEKLTQHRRELQGGPVCTNSSP